MPNSLNVRQSNPSFSKERLKDLMILSVDDDQRMLDLLDAQLSVLGVNLVGTKNAQEALNILEQGFLPNVILCDVMMPEQDGYSFHQRIRQNAHWLRIPFVYVTALGDESDYRQGMSQGADGYLKKPFSQEELLQEILLVLNRHADVEGQSDVHISLLDGQAVRRGNAIDRAPDRGAEQLVFYLLVQGLNIKRKRLDVMASLWGDITLSGFRSVLSRARRWSEPWIDWDIDKHSVMIDLKPHVHCDLYDLERALEARESDKIIEALYRGPLMPAYQERWVIVKREELSERVKASLLEQAQCYSQPKERAQALRRVTHIDPSDFDVWDMYIDNLMEAGLHIEARQAREQLERAL